jgi:hypothetical protein
LNASPIPFPPGDQPRIAQVADWVELSALARKAAFKRGDLKSAIASEDVTHSDVLEQSVWHELEQRATFLGPRWPLRLHGNRLTRRTPSPVSLDLYRFFCFLGIGSIEHDDRVLFEVAVAQLISALTGTPGLHLGAPASEGMDPSFRKRVEVYQSTSRLLDKEIKAAPLPDDKDLGLDGVTWRRFSDERGADLHFLVQCATGDDWQTKLHDINLTVWADHIHWAVTPVRMFAVPTVISQDEAKWVRTSRKGGLILDRPRLVELALSVTISSPLLAQLRERNKLLAA